MESMSNVPYYLSKARSGFKYGNQECFDGILLDGLWDKKYQMHMGECAESTAVKYGITREQQDRYAIRSYRNAKKAWEVIAINEFKLNGTFQNEVTPVEINLKGKKHLLQEDEEYKKVNFEKISTLRPAFKENGTITAANASTLNDGASAVILASYAKIKELNLSPVARIIGYADAERDPKEFSISPSDSIEKALRFVKKDISDISLFEINEAFSVVACANQKILGIGQDKLNIAGGGVSLGHPIGSSGCRILVTLINLLKCNEFGCASICNGGGGSTSIIVQKL
ncbi:hypothetical protein ROZALSC1DRAFT_27498 [Rozella allomycis CSF55]|uniref:Thiolase-like, subgroup domain-containing protein n=1 Tax=Rozella allomycis (strain CSF55) TaxID=988480 RepID=A0A075AQ23_ROZAC|nr:Thiolase-like, subgroup domain-containing protein [Rozella allomycis CSF55]RKP21058.1 hypothetical protein ROZALSC1DRAFT_27498 [Rozella allomycis CSF55]|eukprot:EPZ32336.1 Thiolase-like, subgroup domain-containing protein [Rozella allomycis CSF55]